MDENEIIDFKSNTVLCFGRGNVQIVVVVRQNKNESVLGILVV